MCRDVFWHVIGRTSLTQYFQFSRSETQSTVNRSQNLSLIRRKSLIKCVGVRTYEIIAKIGPSWEDSDAYASTCEILNLNVILTTSTKLIFYSFRIFSNSQFLFQSPKSSACASIILLQIQDPFLKFD